MQREPELKDFIKKESTRKVFAKVFDESTIMTVHELAVKNFFDELEFVISTGKEAHVFRARDKSNNYRAVKVYKISTSNFKHMIEYIAGDPRFKGIQKNKRDVVFAWTKKEFKNLERAKNAGARVPTPLGFLNNVLVMEFIGENGKAAKTLKETRIEDIQGVYDKMIEFTARLFKAGLVHSDLSEYNVLVKGNELVLIDIGQAVLTSHPNAENFFERDLKNLSNYFKKHGLNKSKEQIRQDIKRFTAKKI